MISCVIPHLYNFTQPILGLFSHACTTSEMQLFGMDFKVADRFTMEWEAELIKQLLAYAQELEDEQDGFHLHISITRRYDVLKRVIAAKL